MHTYESLHHCPRLEPRNSDAIPATAPAKALPTGPTAHLHTPRNLKTFLRNRGFAQWHMPQLSLFQFRRLCVRNSLTLPLER